MSEKTSAMAISTSVRVDPVVTTSSTTSPARYGGASLATVENTVATTAAMTRGRYGASSVRSSAARP